MSLKLHNIIHTADLVINTETGNLQSKGSTPHRLSPVNMKVLQLLTTNHGNVVSRAHIFKVVWPNQEVSDDALTRCISDIRSVLSKLSNGPSLIETIPKKGYRWVQPVIAQQENLSVGTTTQANAMRSQIFIWIKWLPLYILAALAMLSLSAWLFITFASPPNSNIAILTPVVANGQNNTQTRDYQDALVALFVKHPELEVLSENVIIHQAYDIYPSLYQKFGTRWTIETSIREKSNGNIRIVTSLIDARNAFVILRQVNSYEESIYWADEEAKKFFNKATQQLAPN